MRTTTKRLCALLLALVMVIGLLPTLAFAEGETAPVTYMVGNAFFGAQTVALGDAVNLPAAAVAFPYWTFLGWVDQPVETTQLKPGFYQPGASYTVNADSVFYALYKRHENDGGVAYELVRPGSGVTDGVYVITSGTTENMWVMLLSSPPA